MCIFFLTGHPAGKRKQCPPAHPAHQHRTRTGFAWRQTPEWKKDYGGSLRVTSILLWQRLWDIKGRIKCNPSIKTSEDRNALRKALSTNLIDVIGTDHAPHLLKEKEGGAFKAVSGMPMIQFSLVAIMELVREGILSIEQLVQKMCHAPAELYHIERRGYIRPGYQADLVLVNPDHEWTVILVRDDFGLPCFTVNQITIDECFFYPCVEFLSFHRSPSAFA